VQINPHNLPGRFRRKTAGRVISGVHAPEENVVGAVLVEKPQCTPIEGPSREGDGPGRVTCAKGNFILAMGTGERFTETTDAVPAAAWG
jgi:hypothetical protein